MPYKQGMQAAVVLQQWDSASGRSDMSMLIGRAVLHTTPYAQVAEVGYSPAALKLDYKRRASWEHIVLNHYVLKSREEFAAKVARSNGMNDPKPVTYFDEIDALATGDCTYAAELYPATQD